MGGANYNREGGIGMDLGDLRQGKLPDPNPPSASSAFGKQPHGCVDAELVLLMF